MVSPHCCQKLSFYAAWWSWAVNVLYKPILCVPTMPRLEVLAGQPSISSFSMLQLAPGQWWALEMAHQSRLGKSGVLVFKLHLNNIFALLMGASFVTEGKSWPAGGRGREGELEVAGGCTERLC